MNKLLQVFIEATTIVIGIHFLSFTTLYLTNNFTKQDFLHILPVSVVILFVPIFLTSFYFKREQKLKTITIAALSTFLITYLLIKVIDNTWLKVFGIKSIFNGAIAFFISVLYSLLQLVISEKSFFSKEKSKVSVKYSLKRIVLIPLSGAIIYSVYIYFGSSSSFNLIPVWYKLFPLGLIIALFTIHFNNYVYTKYTATYRNFLIVTLYLSVNIIMPALIFLTRDSFYVYDENYIDKFKSFIRPIIATIILFAPFYTYVLILTHLYFLSLLHKQEKKKLKEQSLTLQLNYQQLKKQLSPHFLFNNISVLTGLIEENPKRAINFSQKLANVYRYFLDNEKNDVVKLKDELSFAKDYVELIKMRFEEGIYFTIDIPEENQEKYILSNSLQQILENVIKHNEVSRDNPVNININVNTDYLTIQNNINQKLINQKESGNGVNNIKSRYSYFSDREVIIQKTEGIYTIELPLLSI
ncbi:sensor histidine kinase [Tenacibaculum amylolyticum]|uniref:sensor histidine kinase n=1 Tax=Tenacibaculum amylolyticum TaxID=104269 RepID=UPI003894F4C9